MSDHTEHTGPTEGTSGGKRVRKAAIIVLAIVVAVFVLFTWVFPWITELGFSPALD